MKTIKFKNRLKLGIFSLTLLSFGLMNAQQTTGDVTQGADATPGTVGGTVRVIDNKGTIKYLQSQNGITTFTNTTNDVTTTTWQLGGTLTNDTYIDVDGNAFALNGIELETGAASTDATTGTDHGAGTGYAILVRDEVTGATKKLLAADLMQSGHEVFTASGAQAIAAPGADVPLTLAGSPVLPTFSQVWVYRNGAKLLANTDYEVSGAIVTLKTFTPNSLPLFENDVIEVQYVK